MDREALLDALRRPESYLLQPDTVSHLSTHISDLFFAGDRVYKVKKPVDFGFLDFSRLEMRKHYCEEEVRLNLRLAPRVYLGVVPIVSTPTGGVRVGGAGAALEYAVEMRRLPANQMLDRLLERGEIDNDLLDGLANLLASFHARAATGAGVEEFGTLEAVTRNVLENFSQTEQFVAPPGGTSPSGLQVFTMRLHRFLRDRTASFLQEHRERFERRVGDGRIRDGHGDLHAGNICFTAGGIVAYDCIEFSPRFRCGDVACDLAFLAMDLDLRCFRGFSDYLVYRYAQAAEDPGASELIPFYKCYRAMVRAKVGALFALGCADPAERERARREAMRYAHLAATYWLPPTLILACGLPASGKSYAAQAVARAFEAVVLRSDALRKQLPRATGNASEAVSYAREAKDRVYQRMAELARASLARGRTVVLDATFGRRVDRANAASLANDLGCPLVVMHTTASRPTTEERMRRRANDPREISEADQAVYDLLAPAFEPPDEVPADRRVSIAEELCAEEIVARVIEACS